MAMINLYSLLKVSLSASDDEIRCALKRAADEQILDWERWQTCRKVLLNPDLRAKYNAKLLTENPQLRQEIIPGLLEPVETKVGKSEEYRLFNENEYRPKYSFTIKIPFLALKRKLTPMFNPDTGEFKIAYTGLSITPFFMGFLTPLLVKDVRGSLYWFIWCVIISFLGVQLNFPRLGTLLFIALMCFCYCNQYTKHLLKQGFKFCGTSEQNYRAARILKMELNSANTVSDVKVTQIKNGILDNLVRLFIFFPIAIVCLYLIRIVYSVLTEVFINLSLIFISAK
ncbi:hypothetical protein BGI32_06250 [Snodgrassella alvi]|uniref:Uncharacterized protein n=1 Tax=Snodgrassella alvi TaxID=1196083 RepID=A0A2N9WTU1_9NEIS|nr:hypothetical protein [Snodgrassella alvi]PIT15096.1 hypothetical protein BGI32_06250 [Snodgrassella alvi]